MQLDASTWHGRRVLLTGHTGFKGAWLALWLERLGAQVVGLSLPPESPDGAFSRLAPWELASHLGDIRDAGFVRNVVEQAAPSVVLHLAAEAIVRRAYRHPVETFETNVMGTINVLEATRACPDVHAVLVITSDKVYRDATQQPAKEDAALGHVDPYSSSKACVELLVRAWRASYLAPRAVVAATARAGNVIGGGDMASDRLVPDVLRADVAGVPVVLRNPQAIRPWQHVLDPLHGYLLYAQRLLQRERDLPLALNFGPDDLSWTVRDVIESLQRSMGRGRVEVTEERGPSEAPALLLDSSLAKRSLGWRPVLTTEEAVQLTAEWHGAQLEGRDLRQVATRQLEMFEERALN